MNEFGTDFRFTLFTNDPALARRGDEAGVDCIGLDLESVGKVQRQGHLSDVWISDHIESQLPSIRAALTEARLFVRTNPIHDGIGDEVERLIDGGAEILMLPMFTGPNEVSKFVELVAGRAEVSLLLETAPAAVRLHEIARVGGIDEISIGLNDLHLSLGLTSHFEVLGSGMIDWLAEEVCAAGIRFGFGGLGRAGDTSLPIPSDLVYSQFARLNAGSARIARVFLMPDADRVDFKAEIDRARGRLSYWRERPEAELIAARDELRRIVRRGF